MRRHRQRRDGKLDLLSRVGTFKRLDPDELQLLGSAADIIDRPRGTLLIEQGRYALESFVIVSGEVQVIRDGDEIARLGPGDVVGELGVLDGVPRTASVVAATDVELAVFDVRSLQRMMSGSPPFDTAVRRAAAARRVTT